MKKNFFQVSLILAVGIIIYYFFALIVCGDAGNPTQFQCIASWKHPVITDLVIAFGVIAFSVIKLGE